MAALALIWGSAFLCIKFALRGFSPLQIVFGRLLLGFAVLAPIVLSRGMRLPRSARTWGHLAVAAVVANVIPYTLFNVGEQSIGSNVAGVINATTPLWTLLVALLLRAERGITVANGVGFALGFLGVMLIFSPWQSAGEIASWGGVACLIASAGYGVGYAYIARFLTSRGLDPLVLATGQLAAASVITGLFMPLAGTQSPSWRPEAIVSVLVLGVLGTGIAYILNYRIIVEDGPTIASTVTYLLPVVAVILGWLVLGETLTLTMVAGSVLVLAGVALTRRPRASAAREPDTAERAAA